MNEDGRVRCLYHGLQFPGLRNNDDVARLEHDVVLRIGIVEDL